MNDATTVNVRRASWPADADSLRALRETVFIEEQGVPRDIEWDGRDGEAEHVLAESAGGVIGCGRLLPDGRIGRLAVLREFRNRQVGARLLVELLDLARSRGDLAVYLHAQADAVRFYERAGFQTRGEPFDEAGIRHVDMLLEFDYRDWNRDLVNLRYPQPFAQLLVAQARQAQRELRILSPRLDHAVFDNEELSAAIRRLVRRARMSRVMILVQDARAVTQRGHALLQLARRMPSGVEMRRLAEHPQWNGETEVLRDRDSLLAMPASTQALGFYRPASRSRAESALTRFDELWSAASVDPEFRALAL